MVYGDDPAAMSRGLLDLEAEYYLPSVLAMRQSANLFVYTTNNPTFYTDPSGEAILFTPIVVGALIGGAVSAALNIHSQITNFNAPINKLNLPSVGISFLTGAVSGAIAGSPIGLGGQIAANAILGGAESVLQSKVNNKPISLNDVAFNAGIGAVAGLAGGSGAQYSKITYTKTRNIGPFPSSVTKTYTKRITQSAAHKALTKGLTYTVLHLLGKRNEVIVCMNELFIFICYLYICCAIAKELAKCGSFLAVPVSDSWRHILLILDYSRKKISVMCIISQVYAYFMLIFYVAANASAFLNLNLFIASESANLLFNYLLRFHYFVIFPFSCIELAFYYFVNKIFNLRK